jgi:hypothetical protein
VRRYALAYAVEATRLLSLLLSRTVRIGHLRERLDGTFVASEVSWRGGQDAADRDLRNHVAGAYAELDIDRDDRLATVGADHCRLGVPAAPQVVQGAGGPAPSSSHLSPHPTIETSTAKNSLPMAVRVYSARTSFS